MKVRTCGGRHWLAVHAVLLAGRTPRGDAPAVGKSLAHCLHTHENKVRTFLDESSGRGMAGSAALT
jgi:hypothetical protein